MTTLSSVIDCNNTKLSTNFCQKHFQGNKIIDSAVYGKGNALKMNEIPSIALPLDPLVWFPFIIVCLLKVAEQERSKQI